VDVIKLLNDAWVFSLKKLTFLSFVVVFHIVPKNIKKQLENLINAKRKVKFLHILNKINIYVIRISNNDIHSYQKQYYIVWISTNYSGIFE
jgi:hypothetical protein